jgi:Rod binding domain-containing protein
MGVSDALAAANLASPAGRLSSSVSPPANAAQRRLMQATKDFESLLVHELLKEMKQTIPARGEDDAAGEQIQDMFWSYLSQEVSNKGGLGLWKSLYRQMSAAAPAAPAMEHSS